MPTANFIAWAAIKNTKKVLALIMSPMKVATVTALDLYLSDHGGVWDGAHYWVPNVISVPTVKRTADSLTYGKSLIDGGTIEIVFDRTKTMDPASSVTWNALLTPGAYAFLGHPISIKVGGPGLAWADWAAVVDGYMGQPSVTDDSVSFKVYTKAERIVSTQIPPLAYGDSGDFLAWQASTAYALGYLLRPTVPSGNYFYECTTAGTSGGGEPAWGTSATVNDNGIVWTRRELPSSTIGKAKPLVYGAVSNFSPILIDSASHLYQFHDDQYGPVNSVVNVYKDGLLITTGFTTNATYGWIKFTSDPQGTITVDLQGRKVGGSYISLPGDIVSDILQTFGGVSAGDLVSADFTAYNTDVPYAVGLGLDAKNAMSSVLDSLLMGLLSIWGNNRNGDWTIRHITPAAGAPDLELTEVELLSWELLPAGEDSDAKTLCWKATINADRNYTVISTPAATVSEDRKTWLKDPFRSRSDEDAAVKVLYPLADEEGPHDTCLNSLTDAATVAGWWLTMYGTQRYLMIVESKLQGMDVELGDSVQVTRDDFGLDAGIIGTVVKIEETYGYQARMKLGVMV